MKQSGDTLLLSATDLANHLACRHLTQVDREVAQKRLDPPEWRDPSLKVLQERGLEHERAYLEHLERTGLQIERLADSEAPESAFEGTVAAMKAGHDVIVQATLVSGRWVGRADVLRKVDRKSNLGAWSYEVVDTKLARETRGGTILQLCMYSDIVGEIQGRMPEQMYVVTPGSDFEPARYRVEDYTAFYRVVRRRLEAAADGPRAETYPDPVPHCDICRWRLACDRRRRADDHLSLVAGVSRLQSRELEARNVGTLAGLAATPLPLAFRPSRGALEGYVRVREQARVQLEGRTQKKPVYELLAREAGRGLQRLPEPSAGDVFFDLEGDPFVADGGIEYVFGWAVLGDDGEPEYEVRWAHDREEEKRALEALVDMLLQRVERYPDLHIYHFGAYEPAALKRLMGRYATREDEIDGLLSAGRFVDLHSIVKQSMRASVEEYSIKKLEAFYGFQRAIALERASKAQRLVQHALELGRVHVITDGMRKDVRAYNRDDCISTLALRDWLEQLRGERVEAGEQLSRPELKDGKVSEATAERREEVAIVRGGLLEGIAADPAGRSAEAQARWLLGNLLEWHRREERAPWWEYFRLIELTDDELFDEKSAISGLEHVERLRMEGKRALDRYRYPAQETRIREDDVLYWREDEVGEVADIDLVKRTIDVKKRMKANDLHPASAFKHRVVRGVAQAGSLLRLGRHVLERGLVEDGDRRSARQLLLNLPPEFKGGDRVQMQEPGETPVQAARRLVHLLDHGVLAIQGPPGTGKTYTGARMIVDCVKAGKRVGVTAQSHAVIRNLLNAVLRAAGGEHVEVRCAHKPGERPDPEIDGLVHVGSNEDARQAIESGACHVLGGTTWMWAREEFAGAVDVLFVDEAGQMSLANVLAVVQAADSMVLLGDPQQLEQPTQGSHPDGTGVSALEHILEGRKTIADDRGLFLDETWRLHPDICAFTSDFFYEGRLRALDGLGAQRLDVPAPYAGAGLWFVPVEHDGNQTASTEEVETVADIVAVLLHESARWLDRHREPRAMEMDDILIVAPFNAQVADIRRRLPRARVGTVDKFQGQQAPVVIVSLTTSSPEDAPRGMEFLFSLNRFNVATSRARCACIVVGSPRLFAPDCQTPRQMQLANGFCGYLERAKELAGAGIPGMTAGHS